MSVSVLIGIQARSGSKRLPGKSLKIIEDKAMIDHVYSAAKRASGYVSRTKMEPKIVCNVALLIPTGDPIKDHFPDSIIIEGDENNVLDRYEKAFNQLKPDYLVRITGDCPLIIPTIISKHIFCAVSSKSDYLSNTFDELRSYVDGFDCEVLSADMFKWVVNHVETDEDKEHVTSIIKRLRPEGPSYGVLLNHIDLSDIKLSVDTLEEFERVERLFRQISQKFTKAKGMGYNVFRF